jgi:hypothetical protein
MQEIVDWHQLFGLIVVDYLHEEPVDIQREVDVSLVQQLMDMVLIKEGDHEFKRALPDGMQDWLRRHNVISFKSHSETFGIDALDELFAGFVNYRKQVSPRSNRPVDRDQFRVLAICARFPLTLSKELPLTQVSAGVYESKYGVTTIRMVVASQLPLTANNAILHLFSASGEVLRYGMENYGPVNPDRSSLVRELFKGYELEGFEMPMTLEEFIERSNGRYLEETPAAEILKHKPAEEFLRVISPEERVKGLAPEERVKGLSVEELLAVLSAEDQEKLRQKLQNPSS